MPLTTIFVEDQEKPYFVSEPYDFVRRLVQDCEPHQFIELTRISGIKITLRVGAINVVADTHNS